MNCVHPDCQNVGIYQGTDGLLCSEHVRYCRECNVFTTSDVCSQCFKQTVPQYGDILIKLPPIFPLPFDGCEKVMIPVFHVWCHGGRMLCGRCNNPAPCFDDCWEFPGFPDEPEQWHHEEELLMKIGEKTSIKIPFPIPQIQLKEFFQPKSRKLRELGWLLMLTSLGLCELPTETVGAKRFWHFGNDTLAILAQFYVDREHDRFQFDAKKLNARWDGPRGQIVQEIIGKNNIQYCGKGIYSIRTFWSLSMVPPH